MGNSIPYDIKSFEAVLTQINSNNELKDKPDWWKNDIAGIRDSVALMNDAVANNTLLSTSYTRRNIEEILRLIDYSIAPQSTASGYAIFYLKSTVVFPFTVTTANLSALTQGTVSVAAKRFEARADVVVILDTESINPGDINIGNDRITVTRVFTTGEKVRFTTTNTLPAILQLNTDYYVIKISATEIKIATTLALAYAGTGVDFADQGVGVHTATLYSFITTVYQQETKTSQIIGTSDGATKFQEFELPDNNVLYDTIKITINSVLWTKQVSLIDSLTTDTHYRYIYDFDNAVKIMFGDGITFGAIPGAFSIYAEYAVGGGTNSNVTVINALNIYAGNDTNINGVSNPASLTGGANVESIESTKIIAPQLLKSRGRFVTADDGKFLAMNYPGISLAECIKNAYGVLSAKIICIADGGGNPSAGVKTALQTYLIDLTELESMDIRVVDTTITTIAVTSAAKMKPGYTYTGDIENYFRLAWELWLSPSGYEIYLDYTSNGLESAITLLNTIFAETFSTTDSDDLIQIEILLEGLKDNYRLIGEDIFGSDTNAYIELVTGIDYFTTTLAFPIVTAADEIVNFGALTLSEI